ncbi:MAG TPA: 23S rRNA (guanosine(2251)-2'-O)-methyltransferase RlmB [Chloroflexota bacterium]|nr:23S rRNA (guanosine(2251)-2'-O)-methyltransferase RlmB [Chloroflexota bacterium]
MSSDWNKKRRSGGDDRRENHNRPRQFPRRDEEGQTSFRRPTRDHAAPQGSFQRDQRDAPRTGFRRDQEDQRAPRQGARENAPPRSGFQRDQRDAPRTGFRRDQEGQRAPNQGARESTSPRSGFQRDQAGAPRTGFRRDDRGRETEQGWQPFESPFGGERDRRGERGSSFGDRERPDLRRDRDDPRGERDRVDDRSARRPAQGYGRPWQREDQAPFDRRPRDQDRSSQGDRSFPGRGGERERPFRPRDDEGYAPRGERRFGGDRPSFDARHQETRREGSGGRPEFGRGRPFQRQEERPSFERGRFRDDRARQGHGPASEAERIQADVYGRWPVLEALRAGHVEKIYMATGVNDTAEHLQEVQALANEQHIPLARVDRLALDRMLSGANHQGVAAATKPFQYASFDAVLERTKSSEALPLLVLFDSVQDPQNLGSILRTAEAAGAQGAVLPRHQQAGVTPAVVRASAGAVEHLPVAQVTNLRQSVERLKEAGYWIVGLDMEGGTDYDNLDVDSPIALIVGSEGRGVGRLVAEQCDYLVRLPMRGRIDSLNASVATGIVLYEIQRRRDEQRRRSAKVRKAGATSATAAVDLASERADEPAADEVSPQAESPDRTMLDHVTIETDGATDTYPVEPEALSAEVHETLIEGLGDLQE